MRGIKMMLGLVLFASLVPAEGRDFVRVRLKKNASRVHFKGLGLKVLSDDSSMVPIGLAQMKSAQISLDNKQQNPVWKVSFSDQSKTIYYHTSVLEIQGDTLRMGIEPIPRRIKLYPVEKGRIDVIAELEIESYLAGVLPSEMPAGWPIEALKAQVVASRTYMRSLMHQRRLKHYDLEASVYDQVYRLLNHMSLSEKVAAKVSRAIKETRGEILADASGQIHRAYYHSDCGGQTEEPTHIWGGSQLNGTVKDSFCPKSPHGNWRIEIQKSEIKKRLSRYVKRSPKAKLGGVFVSERLPSGRAKSLDIIYEQGPTQKISGHNFRKLLGFSKVKSTKFRLHHLSNSIVIEGSGNGHGVGMCQWGAKSLAEKGSAYEEILSHYYPKAQLHKGRVRFRASVESESDEAI